MEFPEFGLKEILAALVDGKGKHMSELDRKAFGPMVEEGTIMVEMGQFVVLVGPAPEGIRINAIEKNGNEFFFGAPVNKWFAV